MAPQDKKWDDAAQRDLCLAIIQSSQDGDKFRLNWGPILTIMHDLGYSFTKDAVSQHFTKVMIKDFKNRHAQSALMRADDAAADQPVVAKGVPRKRAPNKKGAKKRSKGEAEPSDGQEANDEDRQVKKVHA